MKAYIHPNPQLILLVTDDLATFEYVRPNEPVESAVRRAAAAINRTSPDAYVRCPTLDFPQLHPLKINARELPNSHP